MAVDVLAMAPVAGVEFIQIDFLDAGAPDAIRTARRPADVVLSDMAANATGHRRTDHLKIMALAEAAADFAREVLAPGGAFLCKVLQGGTETALLACAPARLHRCEARQARGQSGGFGGALSAGDRLSRPRVARLSPRMPADRRLLSSAVVPAGRGQANAPRQLRSGIGRHAREREAAQAAIAPMARKAGWKSAAVISACPRATPSARPPARRWRRRSRSTPAGRPPPARWRGSCGGCRRRRRRWC